MHLTDLQEMLVAPGVYESNKKLQTQTGFGSGQHHTLLTSEFRISEANNNKQKEIEETMVGSF